MTAEFAAELIASEAVTSDVMLFVFEKPADFSYAAGQFFFVTLSEGLDSELTHHFTISTSPTEDTLAFATKMTGSAYKDALGRLRAGQKCRLKGPYGRFVLEDDTAVIFLVGGIGATPALSMCRYIADTGLGTEVTMFFANRDAHEIPFRREFDGLAAANGNLKVVYVISRPDDGWGGHRGHIDAPLVKKEAPDYADRKFYVSGPPNMVHGMESVLKELGVADALIKRELFVGY